MILGIFLNFFTLCLLLTFVSRLKCLQWTYFPHYPVSEYLDPRFLHQKDINATSGSIQSIAFYPQLPGFPVISLPDNARDSCFPRIKAAFDRAFPEIPRANLRTSDSVGAQPNPRFLSQLPASVQPVYARETGPNFVPYKLPTSQFPMYVALDRETNRLLYPQLKVLLPYAKLATTQWPYGRKYVIYLPFQPDPFRNSSCGEPIYIPFPSRDGEFFIYRQYSLDTTQANKHFGGSTSISSYLGTMKH
ncbi:uncharacterized protein LOC134272872 [Saccostrea cucullata]|uniref:uncharacterized protein LOC134272872 n=1 Tax=Saccostrea cuccullata TaxID=36930 RepID=UPI002ED697E0